MQYVQDNWPMNHAIRVLPPKFLGAQKFGCLYSLDWTTGLDYWTDLFATKNHFYAFYVITLTCHLDSMT